MTIAALVAAKPARSAFSIPAKANASAMTISTASDNTNNNAASIVLNNINTESYNAGTIYFRVTTPQGSAATGNVTVCYFPLP